MTRDEFVSHYILLHPRPEKPVLLRYLFRVDFILLILAAIGGVTFSASRTFTLIAEQSGSMIAAFAVFALEFSLAGLILSQARKSTGRFMNFLRAWSVWITIFLLLFILIVTNASYEIKQVNLMVPEAALQWVLVFFLGVLIPVLVFINMDNLATSIPEHLEEYKKAVDKYYYDLEAWEERLEDGWEDERTKEFAEDKPMTAYLKQDRRQFIQELLAKGEKINKTKLAEKFNVSTTTIINDVKELTPVKPTQKEDEVESQF